MAASFASPLDPLLAALDAARSALQDGATDLGLGALDEAFGALGSLYALLDSRRHPEMSAYLQFVYDACLQHIGAAGPGRCERLTSAIELLLPLLRAEEGARRSGWPADRPSFIARAIGV
ncbi:MAG: hypothetical protein WBY94_25885 [Polyangiaceae bacterium]